MKSARVLFLASALAFAVSVAGSADDRPAPVLDATFKSIHSILLVPKCAKCHTGERPKAGFDVSTYDKILAAKDVVIPGHSKESILHQVLEIGDMPAGRDGVPFTKEQVEMIAKWIDLGAAND